MTDDQTPTSWDEEDAAASESVVDPGPAADEDAAEPDGVPDISLDEQPDELAGELVDEVTPDSADPADMVIDDEARLADAEQVAAAAVSTRPVRRNAPVKRVPVDKSAEGIKTRSRAEATKSVDHGKKRTTPGEFVEQSVGELRKVIWPTGDQLRQYFIVVLVFVLFIMTYVGLLDLLFGWGLLKLLGQ